MAGLVNITLLIQIGNFVITYYFMHKLFFRPFITFIEKKEAAKKSFFTKLKEKELLLAGLLDEKAAHLSTFQKTIKSSYTLAPLAQKETIPPPHLPPDDELERKQLLKDMTQLLEKKVSDVF